MKQKIARNTCQSLVGLTFNLYKSNQKRCSLERKPFTPGNQQDIMRQEASILDARADEAFDLWALASRVSDLPEWEIEEYQCYGSYNKGEGPTASEVAYILNAARKLCEGRGSLGELDSAQKLARKLALDAEVYLRLSIVLDRNF